MGNTLCTGSATRAITAQADRYAGVKTFDLDVLKNIDIFVLDNSIRETTVAQLKGHVLGDKVKIFNAIQGLGINDFIVAVYTEVKSVDDEIASMIADQDKCNGNQLYCFSECFDLVIDQVPCQDIPLGVTKMARYNIAHIIMELSFFSKDINATKFSSKDFAELILSRIQYIKQYVNPQARILLNVRDGLYPWFAKMNNAKAEKDLLHFFTILASFPEEFKLFAIMSEEPAGLVFPWEMALATKTITNLFKKCGWHNYHFLIHVHKGYGQAEAVVMASLSNGATGIWCGVCEEGAITGHASSLMTLVNLARLGNQQVNRRFNLSKMRNAAIAVTEITTGCLPNGKQEIYGARAFDVIAEGMDLTVEIDPVDLLGVSPETRISSIATNNMLRNRLNEVFGTHDWDIEVLNNMRSRVYADLLAGKKYEYQSSIGLMNLYERSNGQEHFADMLMVIERDPMFRRLENHRLMVELKDHFFSRCDMKIGHSFTMDDKCSLENVSVSTPKEHVLRTVQSMSIKNVSFALSSVDVTEAEFTRSNSYISPDLCTTSPSQGANADTHLDVLMALQRVDSIDLKSSNDDHFDFSVVAGTGAAAEEPINIKSYSMSYKRFHQTYLSNWMPSTNCERFAEIVKILDANEDGGIEWGEIEIRAKWALSEFDTLTEHWQLDDFIQNIFETFIFTELKQPKRSLRRQFVSFSLHNSKTLRLHDFQFDKNDFRSRDGSKLTLGHPNSSSID